MRAYAWVVGVVLFAIGARLWRDEVVIVRQRETNLLQHQWNQAVKQDNDQLRTGYNYIFREWQKCDPLVGSEDHDVFCHADQCVYLDKADEHFPTPKELQ